MYWESRNYDVVINDKGNWGLGIGNGEQGTVCRVCDTLNNFESNR